MQGLYLIDMAAAEQIAANRAVNKTGLKSQHIFAERHEITGTVGEMAFHQFSGLPMETGVIQGGDGGSDFDFEVTVDVKTASKTPRHMIVPEGKVRATLYVMAVYRKPCSVELLGWQWGYKVRSYPVDDGVTYKFRNHLVPVADLLPMAHIRKFLPTWNQ